MTIDVCTAGVRAMRGRTIPVVHLRLSLALLALVAAACDNPSKPSDVTSDAVTTVTISGRVTDEDGSPVSGAVVSIDSRPGLAVQLASADHDGRYQLGPFQVSQAMLRANFIMRAWLDGFIHQEKEVAPAEQVVVDFQLRRVQREHYVLTIFASPTCALPEAAMIRRYDAQVDTLDSVLLVELSGADFVGWGARAGFTGTRDGATVTFQITDHLDAEYALIERVPGVGDLHFSGTANGTVTDRGIVAVLAGRIALSPSWSATAGNGCEAADHRLEFVR